MNLGGMIRSHINQKKNEFSFLSKDKVESRKSAHTSASFYEVIHEEDIYFFIMLSHFI